VDGLDEERESGAQMALGFGVKTREDVAFLTGKSDIAISYTEAVRQLSTNGVECMGEFLGSLRDPIG
jgi:tryptophan synthase alpha chain